MNDSTTTPFYVVTSENRHAVRKLLTAHGHSSSEVVRMRNGQLGKALHDAVSAGTIARDAADAACRHVSVTQDSSKQDRPAAGDGEAPPDTNSADSETDSSAEAEEVEMSEAEEQQASEQQSDTDSQDQSKNPPPNLDFQCLQDGRPMLLPAAQLFAMLPKPKEQPKPEVDKKTVEKIVREAFKREQEKPAIVEIRTETETQKLDGSELHAAFPDVLRTISTRVQGRRLHCWLGGPSGSGKSYLASQCAQALKLDYYSTSAIQSKYDLIGFFSPTGDEKTLLTPFRRAFEFGGVFAWDDIDASDPRAFVAFNEALSNGRFAFPDKMVEQHPDFVCIASANTWGTGATADYVGRNKIDSATLSRFVRIVVEYDEGLERKLVGAEGKSWAEFVQRVRAAVKSEGIKVLVTPRHTLQGYALLAAGMPLKRVEEVTVFAGLDDDTVSRLRNAA